MEWMEGSSGVCTLCICVFMCVVQCVRMDFCACHVLVNYTVDVHLRDYLSHLSLPLTPPLL